MGQTQLLFESLFKKPFNEPKNKDLLLAIAQEHPYFTAAQFYLLQQTPAQSNDYAKQAAKTAILFNNPFWLNYQLQFGDVVEKDIAPTNLADNTVNDSVAIVEQAPTSMAEMTQEEKDAEELPNVDEKEIEPMHIHLNFPKVSTTNESSISFEPLHTSDYFASMGIKLSQNIAQDDKLGKQLKSFTDWLKTMKKVHVEHLPQPSQQVEAAIQKMAEKSNTKDEVLTEAMAEVLLQQGKAQKAIELYEKLSLLNPAKSAYFASKFNTLAK